MVPVTILKLRWEAHSRDGSLISTCPGTVLRARAGSSPTPAGGVCGSNPRACLPDAYHHEFGWVLLVVTVSEVFDCGGPPLVRLRGCEPRGHLYAYQRTRLVLLVWATAGVVLSPPQYVAGWARFPRWSSQVGFTRPTGTRSITYRTLVTEEGHFWGKSQWVKRRPTACSFHPLRAPSLPCPVPVCYPSPRRRGGVGGPCCLAVVLRH